MSADFKSLAVPILCPNEYCSEDIFLERYKTLFGLTPNLCTPAWQHLTASRWTKHAGRIAHPVHLLWTLLFLKTYSTEQVLSQFIGVDEKTYRKWVWFYLEGISKMSSLFVCISDDCIM